MGQRVYHSCNVNCVEKIVVYTRIKCTTRYMYNTCTCSQIHVLTRAWVHVRACDPNIIMHYVRGCSPSIHGVEVVHYLVHEVTMLLLYG